MSSSSTIAAKPVPKPRRHNTVGISASSDDAVKNVRPNAADGTQNLLLAKSSKEAASEKKLDESTEQKKQHPGGTTNGTERRKSVGTIAAGDGQQKQMQPNAPPPTRRGTFPLQNMPTSSCTPKEGISKQQQQQQQQQRNGQRTIGRPKVQGKRLPMVVQQKPPKSIGGHKTNDGGEEPKRIVPNIPTVKKPPKSVEQNHFLLEELLRECFSPPAAAAAAAAAADMTSFEGAASAGPEAEEERQRPRFSLDRLVPPQLITASDDDDDAEPLSLQSASVSASFVLKRHPSVEIACHGIVQLVGDDTTTTTTKNAAAAEDEYMLSRSANAARFSGDGSDVSGGSTTPTTTASSLPPRLGCSSSPAATDSPRQRHGISLLERLVKCHPIWFLSHLDRQAVAHLLTAQPPGVFIVRASSRGFRPSAVGGGSPASNNSCSIRAPPPPPVPSTKRRVDVMALSVRLAPNSIERASPDAREPELDHFLVEAVGSGTAVRLEGSPYTFNSLPLLLEHYCLDGEGELKVRLNLPQTLARCESIQTLQGIALMGQDFWTSPLSASPPSSSSFSPNSSCPPPPFPPKPVPPAPMVLYNPMTTFGQQHQQQQQQQRSRAVHSPSSVTSSASSPSQLFHLPHHHPPSSLQPPPSSPSPTASSSTFMYCSASSASMEHFPTSQHHCCCCCNPCPSSNHHNGHVPLRKSHSVHGRPLNAFPSRGMRCSWENDGPPSSPQSLREGRVGNGGFLRGLFSPSPQRRHPPPPPPPPPDIGKKTTTNRSRTMANRNDFYGTLWEEPELNGDWSYQQQRRGGGDVVPVAEEQQKGAKSFFARLKGFKRTNSTSSAAAAVGRPKRENSGASFDDSSGTLSQMSPEVLRVRQLAFRRTNTDTGGGAIASALVRLKSLNEGGQQQQQQPPTTTTTSSNRVTPRNGNFPLARVLPQPRTPNKSDGEAMRVGEDGRGGTLRGQQRPPKFATPAIEGICLNSSLHHQHHHQEQYSDAHQPFTATKRHNNGRASDGDDGASPSADNFFKGSATEQQQQHKRLCSSSTTNSSNRTSKTAIAAVRPQLKQMQQPNGGTLVKQRKAPDVPVKSHSSEYSLLGELLTQRRSDQRNSAELAETVVDNTAATAAAGHLNVDETARHGLIIEDEEDDSHSVAGTDFNEPWDSNAWENLMDLARFGDGRMEESPRVSELVPESDSLEMMEKAARMANCSRSHFPHITAGAHRRSLMRAHGTSSLMDISGVGSGTTDHTKSRESGCNESISRTNGLNFGQSSNKQQRHHHRPIPACSSSVDELSTHPNKSTSICPSLVPVFSPSRLRNLANEHPGEEDPAKVIQRYVEALSKDDQTLFEAALHQFIECTLLSREKDPYVVIRRVRQFINGMKNYLMRIGEADLHPIIKRERSRLNIDEFLNIDAILEEVLVKILLAKLKAHLYRLMILESTSNGELRRLTENIAQVRSMSAAELGFPEGTELPDSARMEQISRQLRKMQNHYSPLKKVQLLLRVLSLAVPFASLSSVSGSDHSSRQHNHRPSNELSSPPQQLRTPKAYQHSSSYYALSPALSTLSPAFSMSRHRTTSGSSSCAAAAALKHPPADELIRWLVYLLARSSTINCEIEAWYMWELLPQQVLSTGDASYFLSVLFSAVHVLKHPESIRRLKNVELAQSGGGGAHQLYAFADFMGSQSTLQDSDESDLLLRVAIPNEQEGTIEYHSFPVLPKMNVAKLCRMIAHQFSVTNPEDYRLYLIFDEYEAPMEPTQIPHLMRNQMNETARPHLFVYKRSETNISWSRQAVANFFGANNTTVLMNPPPLMVANGRERR
uniref:Protein sprint n=1 Tax=Globodera rostochiensis TaxID=31243 RepID=A0A914HJD7_GLORO